MELIKIKTLGIEKPIKDGILSIGRHLFAFDCELELAFIENDETHALVFPCRRIPGGWIKAENQEKLIGFQPTHWREWQGGP